MIPAAKKKNSILSLHSNSESYCYDLYKVESIEDVFVLDLNIDDFAIVKVFSKEQKDKNLLLRFRVDQIKMKIGIFAF